MLAMDLSAYPLDGPLPEVPLTNSQQGRQKVIIEMARRENLTIRQLYKKVAGARAHRTICGTAGEIADSLEHWYTSGAADGFNILTPTLPGRLRRLRRAGRAGAAAPRPVPHRNTKAAPCARISGWPRPDNLRAAAAAESRQRKVSG